MSLFLINYIFKYLVTDCSEFIKHFLEQQIYNYSQTVYGHFHYEVI